MAVSTIHTTFSCGIEKVWEVVTSIENFAWRSDISRVEIIGPGKFVEYTKNGYATTFTVTAMIPYQRWSFDMENHNMSGHWTGVFSQEGDKTIIAFTETVVAKRFIMKPFAAMYLKKHQTSYILDLRKALQNEFC